MSEYIDWVDYKEGISTENVLAGGYEDYATIFVARTKLPDGSVHPGKYVVRNGIHVGYAVTEGKEIELKDTDFQIATGEERHFKWIHQSGPFNASSVQANGAIPVAAGFEIIEDGYDFKPIYVARARVSHNGRDVGIVCGKVDEGSTAVVSYGGNQYDSTEYEVLVFSPTYSSPEPSSGPTEIPPYSTPEPSSGPTEIPPYSTPTPSSGPTKVPPYSTPKPSSGPTKVPPYSTPKPSSGPTKVPPYSTPKPSSGPTKVPPYSTPKPSSGSTKKPPYSTPKPSSGFPTGFPNSPFPFPIDESTGMPKMPFPFPIDESTGMPKMPFPFPIDQSTGMPKMPFPFPVDESTGMPKLPFS